MKFKQCVAVVFSLILATSALSAEKLTDVHRQILDKAELALQAESWEEASRIVTALQKEFRKRNIANAHFDGLLAQVANHNKQHKAALERAQPHNGADFNCSVQTGYALLGLNKPADAGVLFDHLAADQKKNLLRRAIAVEGFASVKVVGKKWKRALSAYSYALNVLKPYLGKQGDGIYHSEQDIKHAKVVHARIRKQIGIVRDEMFKEKVGPIFLLYRDAQSLRLHRKDHPNAILKYDELIKKYPLSTYADASRLYRALSMMELKGFSAAERHLLAFIKENEFSLYRGEALLELGRMFVEKKADPDKAILHFNQLDEWIKEVRSGKHSAQLVGVLPTAKDVIAPPKLQFTKNIWGTRRPVRAQHDDLVNRLTAKWYLNSIEKQCAMFKGFLLMIEKENDQAMVQFTRMIKLDSAIEEAEDANLFQTVDRLKLVMKRGYLEGHPSELAMFPKKLRMVIQLGDFYQFTEQYNRARALFAKMEGKFYGTLNRKQLDYIYYAGGNATHFMEWKAGGRSREKVFKAMEKVLEHIDGTYTERKAVLVMVGLATKISGKEQRDLAKRHAWDLLKLGHTDEMSIKTRVNLAMMYHYERNDPVAEKLLNGVPKKARAYDWAQYLIKEFAHIRAKRKAKNQGRER